MSLKFISYPKTPNLKTFYTEFKRQMSYIGKNEDGYPRYDDSKPLPKDIEIVGTVKMHGSNGAIVLPPIGDIYAQSRKRVVTTLSDSFGFANFVDKHNEVLTGLLQKFQVKDCYTTVYGEWIGSGIQNGCSIHNLEQKHFVVFGIKISNVDEEIPAYWVPNYKVATLMNHSINVYNVYEFKTFSLTVDFNKFNNINKLTNEIMLEVEEECPVGKHFGHSGIGEGVVWSFNVNGVVHRFKVKGLKHGNSVSKERKVLTPEQLLQLEHKEKIANELCPEWRLIQGLDDVFDIEDQSNYDELDPKKIGQYIKWMMQDIASEEMDTLHEYGYTMKDVNKYVAAISRQFFFTMYNK